MLVLQVSIVQDLWNQGRPPLRFYRNVWEVRPCMAESESLQVAPDRIIHEAVQVKPRLQGGIQDIRDGKNVECLLKKSLRQWAEPGQERGCNHQIKAIRVVFS